MGKTIVVCNVPSCGEPATHKVAAQWNDERFKDLKTYGFACADHVGDICDAAEIRWLKFEPVSGEFLGQIGIYRYDTDSSDPHYQRDYALEATYLTCPPPV